MVDFVRTAGIAIEVVGSEPEDSRSVRSRLIQTLIRQECAETRSHGFWTHEASITLDAPGCPELDQFELQEIAGRSIVDDVHFGYAEVAASCKDEGRVLATGVAGEQKWLSCDPSHEWPSTTGSRYRLVAPFADR